LPEHPTIVGLIIAFSLNVEFMSPLQNTRHTNTAHLVHIRSVDSRQRARRLICNSKLQVPSLKEFQTTRASKNFKRRIFTRRCLLPNVAGKPNVTWHLSPLGFQHHKRPKPSRCQLIGYSHFNVTRIQPYLITYFDNSRCRSGL